MLIAVNERDPRPIYLQIIAEIKEQIRRGTLRPGDELPPVRELAAGLGVNLHTVRHAYDKLRDEGIILMRLGARTRVAPLRDVPAAGEEIARKITPRLEELITEAFHLGLSTAEIRRLFDALLAQRQERNCDDD